MVGLALTPSYRSIGLAAPVLVIAWRLLQGFSVGGEVGPSLAYLVEAAPPARRGLYCSLQPMTADAAAFCAGLVGVALSSALTPQQLDEFGWRIAFLLGAAIVPVGLALRQALPETLAGAEPASAPPLFWYYIPTVDLDIGCGAVEQLLWVGGGQNSGFTRQQGEIIVAPVDGRNITALFAL